MSRMTRDKGPGEGGAVHREILERTEFIGDLIQPGFHTNYAGYRLNLLFLGTFFLFLG